jgi:hypothetical protein
MDLSKLSLKEIIANKEAIIELKKASVKNTDIFSFNAIKVSVNKAFSEDDGEEDDNGTLKRTIVGNTYNWMDSHDDVHLDGVFSKSIQERGNKILHLHDHKYQLDAKVGINKKVYEKRIKWTDLGINIAGTTTALLMDTEIIKEYNESIFNQYKRGEINQHSVGMQYVKIELAVNDEEEKELFTNWQKHITKIANKERAEQKGYFFAVSEAKLKEISCVIEGSNEVTPTLEPKQFTQVTPSAENRTITDDNSQKQKQLLTNLF